MDRHTRQSNPNKSLWEKGDFTRIAEAMRQSGEELIQTLDVTSEMEVLDLGCGDGTTALPAAQCGARVLGVDIAANLVAAGNRRAKAAELPNLTFQEGDACALVGIADKRFDLVISMFGAMFAPRPFDVAREMVRVTRPGGRIVMGNWIPGDPTLVAQILKICASHTAPPPDGFVSPTLWGLEENVRERFEAAGVAPDRIVFERPLYYFRQDQPPAELLATFEQYYGPTMNAFEAAKAEGRDENLHAELLALFEAQNEGRSRETRIPARYLRVTVEV